jgi:signal transduction histidine kinase
MMESAAPFVPLGERASADELQADARLLEAVPAITSILNGFPALAMFLNPHRQIVLANQRLLDFVGAEALDDINGLRPGEVLECIHSTENEEGCGSTEACAFCGAFRAIVGARLGGAQTWVCRMRHQTAAGEEALELAISATPLEISGRPFTLVCAADVSHGMREDWVEQAVLHEALASAVEIQALAGSFASAGAEAREVLVKLLTAASRRLVSLVREPAELTAAESGRLVVTRQAVAAGELIRDAAAEFDHHPAAEGRQISLQPPSEDAVADTDPGLARKVLGKLLLNALEATPPGGTVTLGAKPSGAGVVFSVHNGGEMPRAARLQLFNRSCSTKGPGRGHGTYYAKLVTERYLGGHVSFHSDASQGTTFTLQLPRLLPREVPR